MFELFDGSNRGSYLDIDNFLCVVRGVVNQERRDLIRRTFQLLDASNEGLLDPQLVIERYDPTQHPDVVTGRKRAQEVFRIFLRTFEVGGEVENKITKNEFYNYYFNLSAAVEEDAYFTALLCGPWHLDQQSFSSSPSGSKKQSPAVTHRINTGKKHGKVNTFSYEDSKEDCSVETSNYKTNTNFDYQDYKFHRIRQPSQSKLLPRSQNEAEKEEVWNSGYSSQRNDIASTRNYHN